MPGLLSGLTRPHVYKSPSLLTTQASCPLTRLGVPDRFPFGWGLGRVKADTSFRRAASGVDSPLVQSDSSDPRLYTPLPWTSPAVVTALGTWVGPGP